MKKENVKLEFAPSFKITEGQDKQGDWLKIGGIALKEGVSRNNNKYTYENLTENNGREFKWLFGHPSDDVEEHVVGLGSLHLNGENLMHEGKIRNTARHPDVIGMVRDNFLGPSIHATAKEITREEGIYKVKGLNIEAVGLVAFQGVKSASIDYAIAESFELKESSNEDVKTTEVTNMKEEKKQEAPLPEEQPKEEAQPEPEQKEEEKSEAEPEKAAEESISQEDIKMLKEELNRLKNKEKNELVESLVKVNRDLKQEDLMKESVSQLKLRMEYENKLSSTNESAAVVESKEEAKEEVALVEKDGSYTMTKEMYAKFNQELREKVR